MNKTIAHILVILCVFLGGIAVGKVISDEYFQTEIQNSNTTPLPHTTPTEVFSEKSSKLPSHVLEGISTKKLDQVYSILKKHYLTPEEITSQKLEEWMIRGILYSVEDPYTEYFNEEQSEEFMSEMSGDFEGIGAVLEKRKGTLYITEVLSKRPAALSGLLPGDIIISVDDQPVKNETIWESVLRIRGEKGTDVTLEIARKGEIKIITVTRANIHVESVALHFVGEKEDIAYLEVSQFGDTLQKEFAKAFQTIQNKDPKGIIIDMRYNGGGYMYGAVDLASYFLPPKTPVVQTKTKHGIQEVLYTDKRNNRDEETPIVILINGGTASSAEIFTAALTEHNRASTVGENTFGKGVVQKIFPLQIGSDEFVKITISAWLTPNGIQVSNEEPLIPSFVVEWDRSDMTEEEFKKGHDPQKDEAIRLME